MNTSLPLFRALALIPLPLLLAGSGSAAPVKVDPQALALLQKVQTATQKTHSLTADATVIYFYHNPEREMRTVGTLRMMKPNYLRQQQWIGQKNKTTGTWEKASDSMTDASDGKTAWLVFYGGEYRKNKADSQGHNLSINLAPTYDFFDASQSVLAQVRQQKAKGQLIALTSAGTQVWEGHSYQLVDWEYKLDYPFGAETTKKAPGGVVTEKDRLFIGADNLVYRVEDAYNVGWSGSRSLRNVHVDAPLTAASFKFTLPPGAHLPVPPPPLLATGTPAPDFTAIAPDGTSVHLSDFKGKTVVLDFWSTWCGPCQMSMPHLEKVYQQVKDKNVAVLGVCVWDKKPEYDKWVVAKKGTYNFPTAFDPAAREQDSIASKLYHVSGIPTQYVIDKEGKIAASTFGYDEGDTELETALNKLGVDIPVPPVQKH
jgi:peroxiredoxin